MILNIILGIIIICTILLAIQFKHDGNMIKADRDHINSDRDFIQSSWYTYRVSGDMSNVKSVKTTVKKSKKKAK